VLYDRNIIGTSSEIFRYLRQSSAIFGTCSENVRRHSPSRRNNFGKSSEIFRKWSEIFGKSSKTSLLVWLYSKQNNTWTLGDTEFIFSCSHSISNSFAALTRSISMWILEDRFHISARPCIILYFCLASLSSLLTVPSWPVQRVWPWICCRFGITSCSRFYKFKLSGHGWITWDLWTDKVVSKL